MISDFKALYGINSAFMRPHSDVSLAPRIRLVKRMYEELPPLSSKRSQRGQQQQLKKLLQQLLATHAKYKKKQARQPVRFENYADQARYMLAEFERRALAAKPENEGPKFIGEYLE